MSLTYLEINQFRNLHQVHIEPDDRLNIITGINASGKTSLLESIFYLSYGRSFRTAYAHEMIKHDHDHFRLFTKLGNSLLMPAPGKFGFKPCCYHPHGILRFQDPRTKTEDIGIVMLSA